MALSPSRARGLEWFDNADHPEPVEGLVETGSEARRNGQSPASPRLPRVALTLRPHDIEYVMLLSKGNAPQSGMFPQKLSVLLVDDEPTVHLAVGSILRQAGYFVEGANDGVAGLRMFKERSWDLVMIDRAMPEMGGEELAEEIRKISPDVPLMLITVFLYSYTRRQLFDGILEKPFTKADLLPITRRLIDKTSRVELQR